MLIRSRGSRSIRSKHPESKMLLSISPLAAIGSGLSPAHLLVSVFSFRFSSRLTEDGDLW